MTGNCQAISTKNRKIKAAKSVIRSVKTVPTNFVNGTLSYLASTPQRAISPPRGITRFVKANTITDKNKFNFPG